MKPKIIYLNGCVEIYTNLEAKLDRLLDTCEFLTRHPNKRGVFYFFKNHAGVAFYLKHEELFKKYFDISDEVDKEMKEWVDYSCGHYKKPLVNLQGVTLEDYQVKALEYMLSRDKYCIFLGMGTGKTIIALTYINSILKTEGKNKFLVVTPKQVIGQYRDEMKKFLAEEYWDCIDYINYESLRKMKPEYHTILYDESHNLKNCSSQVNGIATKLRAPHIYLFTGSPQDKFKHEVLAQLKVLYPYLMPAKYKVYERFFILDEYFNPYKEKPNTELDDIIAKLSYGELTDNLMELPAAHHEIVKCKFEDKTYYNTLSIKKVVEIDGDKILVDKTKGLRMKLKEMCNGHIFYDRFDEDTCKEVRSIKHLENPKIKPMTELLLKLDSAVIYTQFDYDIAVLDKLLTDMNLSHVCVNGKVKNSEELKEKFKQGKVRFLIIQAKSGNAGLNLQVTNNMIFYSLPDSFLIFDQCCRRIRRRGQTKECYYYYLITEGTIEKAIYRSLQNKESFNNKAFILYRREE